MRRKSILSLFMLVMGVALLVAATTVGAATSATQKASKTGAKKGGTLKLNEASADFDFVDPQLAYRTDDWSMLYTTAMQLVELPREDGCRRQPAVSPGSHGVPDGLEGREDLHVPHPPGPEVQRRLARHGCLVPAVRGSGS